MKSKLLILISVILIFSACEEVYTPKPRGFFRLNFPEKEYTQFIAKNRFVVQIPKYATMDTTRADSGWYVLKIPQLKASIYLPFIASAIFFLTSSMVMKYLEKHK